MGKNLKQTGLPTNRYRFAAFIWSVLAVVGVSSGQAAEIDPAAVAVNVQEVATFEFTAQKAGEPLKAHCVADKVGGELLLLFDAENYIPLSSPAPGDTFSMGAGDELTFDIAGTTINPGTGYIGFLVQGAPADFCFPGQDCSSGSADGGTGAQISCEPVSGG